MYNKISREEAKKLWKNGEKIYLLPRREKLYDGWLISVFTDKETHEDFDEFVDKYRWLTSKTGYSSMKFYIEESV